MKIVRFSGFLLCASIVMGQAAKGPDYTADGKLKLPENYREWVYLTSGFDMSYNPGLPMPGHHMFDNVFVNPVSYKAFVEIGTWPDKTLLVLEARIAEGKGSINQQGNYQGAERMGLEVHVKTRHACVADGHFSDSMTRNSRPWFR